MAYAAAMASTEAPPAGRHEAAQPRRAQPPAFPGCKPVHLPRTEIDRFEGRLEYWDAATETAWICEPTTPYHERPSRLLTRLAELIGRVRGSPIESYGSMDLLLRDASGEPRRIMQADESVYLHPAQARLPGPAAMVVGEDDFPDVVLEVDHTTDARRGKLALYESWGFPEVWVDVPDAPSPSRARGRRPGLTIHVLEHGRFRVAAESRAFPGWRAEEIHLALNESTPSAQTSAVVERVAAALGARDGTGPDDDPLLRSQRRQGFERGHAEGRMEGRAEGRVQGQMEGRAEARAQMVLEILRSRGIEVSAQVRRRCGGVAPRRPRRRCWRRRWAARMRRISLPRSAERATTAADLARVAARPIARTPVSLQRDWEARRCPGSRTDAGRVTNFIQGRNTMALAAMKRSAAATVADLILDARARLEPHGAARQRERRS